MIMDDEPYHSAKLGDDNWYPGSATFYDDSQNTNGVSGTCGFPWEFANKVIAVAVPDPRFSDTKSHNVSDFNGAGCGQCFEVVCYPRPRYGSHSFCNSMHSITVRVTNYDTPQSGPWPNNHMDFYKPGFGKIADYAAGIINTKFRRVACPKSVPKFTVTGNPYWHDISVYDVPDVGAVTAVWVRPGGTDHWLETQHGWGAHFWYNGQVNWDDKHTMVRAQMAETGKMIYLMRKQAY